MARPFHRWAATMPREKPVSNKVDVVFALRTSTGYRAEVNGKFDEAAMLVLWRAVCALSVGKPLDVDAIAYDLKAAQSFTQPDTGFKPEGEQKEC